MDFIFLLPYGLNGTSSDDLLIFEITWWTCCISQVLSMFSPRISSYILRMTKFLDVQEAKRFLWYYLCSFKCTHVLWSCLPSYSLMVNFNQLNCVFPNYPSITSNSSPFYTIHLSWNSSSSITPIGYLSNLTLLCLPSYHSMIHHDPQFFLLLWILLVDYLVFLLCPPSFSFRELQLFLVPIKPICIDEIMLLISVICTFHSCFFIWRSENEYRLITLYQFDS